MNTQKPEPHVIPTIGRIVWYRGKDNQVRAAVVTHVWGDFCVNLHAFGKDQNDTEAGIHTSVTHGDIEQEPSCCPSWSWTPYQKGQAQKAEQLEQKLVGSGTASPVAAEIVAKGLTAPRVTPADIEANIISEEYFTAYEGILGNETMNPTGQGLSRNPLSSPYGLLTFCVLVLSNGSTVTGESACASPENFDAELGRKIARQNAVNKIWPLLGFLLKESCMTRKRKTRRRLSASIPTTPLTANP